MVDALSQLLWLSTIRIPTFCTITFKTDFNWSRWFRKLRFFSSKIMKLIYGTTESLLNSNIWKLFTRKCQTNLKWFLQANSFSKKTIFLLVDLISFIFWKKVKTPKRHFEINWPLWMYFLRWSVTIEIDMLSNNDLQNFMSRQIQWPCIVLMPSHEVLRHKVGLA